MRREHRLTPVLVLAVVFLCLPAPATAADKALPEGCLKAVADALPPDLAGFPPGTDKLSLKLQCQRGAGAAKVEWEFERDGQGAFAFRKMRVSEARSPLRGTVFPEKAPAEGPMASLRNCLAAYREKSVENLKRYLPPDVHAGIVRGGADALGHMAEELARVGLTLEDFEKILPRDGALPPRCGRIEIEYGVPGQAKGNPGSLKVNADLLVTAEGAPNWIVKTLHPGFEEGTGAAPGSKDAAAPEGLRKVFAGAPLPDVRGLPAGTRSGELECMAGRAGQALRIGIQFAQAGENGPLQVTRIQIQPEERLEEGLSVPAAAPRETPLDSLRAMIDAWLSADKGKILRYAPAANREQTGKDLDRWLPQLRETSAKEKETKGFTRYETARANLPEGLTAPAEAASVHLSFEVAGEAKGAKGFFEVKVRAFVDDPKADHWVTWEPNVSFRGQ